MIARADAGRLPFPDRCFDLVIGSPPYVDARDYLEDGQDLGISRDCREWVNWMLGITSEALRVSKGLVLWVVSGVTRGRNYQPAPEGLKWEWWKQGGECHCLRPVIWHRYGISGSGGDQWFRADTEYVLAFKRPGKLPWADNTANGQPPKCPPGGAMSHRDAKGTRKGRLMQPPGERGHNGEIQHYVPPDIANPGNWFSTGANGGGNLGSRLAHANEAPYSVEVPAWFIASHCPPGGIVLDPFSGSGTTVDAAISLGRRGVGCDIRSSQCRLSRKRVGNVTRGFQFA